MCDSGSVITVIILIEYHETCLLIVARLLESSVLLDLECGTICQLPKTARLVIQLLNQTVT